MLPFLAESHAVYHAINVVVAEIRMYFLNQWVQLLRGKRTFSSEEIHDCPGENGMNRTFCNPQLDEFIIGIF